MTDAACREPSHVTGRAGSAHPSGPNHPESRCCPSTRTHRRPALAWLARFDGPVAALLVPAGVTCPVEENDSDESTLIKVCGVSSGVRVPTWSRLSGRREWFVVLDVVSRAPMKSNSSLCRVVGVMQSST